MRERHRLDLVKAPKKASVWLMAARRPALHSGEPAEITFDDISVVITRKPIKNLYMRVKPPDGRIEISAPLRMSFSVIERFVLSRRPWIDEMRTRVSEASLTVDGGKGLSEKWTPELRQQAKLEMTEKLSELLPIWTRRIGKSPSAVSLRPMKTRWGSCTPKTARIRLNLELNNLPDRFLEYVLVHELVHLRAAGHGTKFQRLMNDYLPQWRTLRTELNHYVIL